ncbi:hypothetical protein [Haloarchaeobius iranensis]|uniref:Uncharacterized protein n=1 Tax=Haloarchaeobius iranensis TaxID=996166 RepID=A0A1G9X1W4_9EURY|nr:hypothetical protein [Haloarchaeobius iranensis]SDM90677.1 hypothetical protein SAMN05192554_109106 [Haloarchaeobius iranensis]
MGVNETGAAVSTSLSRRRVLQLLGMTGATGLTASELAGAERGRSTTTDGSLVWSTAATSVADARLIGNCPVDTYQRYNTATPGFPGTSQRSPGDVGARSNWTAHVGDVHTQPGHKIDLFTNVSILSVMWIPWLGRWRYTFQVNGIADSYGYGQDSYPQVTSRDEASGPAPIAAHGVTVGQPNIQGRRANETTIVASASDEDAPYAVAHPRQGQDHIDEWATRIAGIRIDEDDVMFGFDVLKAVIMELAGKLATPITVLELTAKGLNALFDEQWGPQEVPKWAERDHTAWFYADDPVDRAAHSRVFSVDVAPRDRATYNAGIVDVRSEAVSDDIVNIYEAEKGIRRARNGQNDSDLSLYHRYTDLVDNTVRIYLPTLPNPANASDSELDEMRDEFGLEPYCLVEDDGDVNENRCLYLASNVEPGFNWY